MQKQLLACCILALFTLFGCSVIDRGSASDADLATEVPDAENFPEGSGRAEKVASGQTMDSELARLNSKVQALETKLEVLTSNMEKSQIRAAQPQITAEIHPSGAEDANLPQEPLKRSTADAAGDASVPTTVAEEAAELAAMEGAPAAINGPQSAQANNAVEREFEKNMRLFQDGSHLEAAAGFQKLALKNSGHLLAAHALFWAGESNARIDQWASAAKNWEKLEKDYSRSMYVPEAMAGLYRANEALGNKAQAVAYRNTLVRAFPNAPATLHLKQKEKRQPLREESVH